MANPSFKRTNVKNFPKVGKNVTSDTVYWRRFRDPVILKEFGAISHIDVSPVQPYYFAVSSSAKVQIYHPITRLPYKNINRFHKAAYGGVFRSDGRLLCAGGEEGVLRLFDVGSKSLLRVFKGHTSAIHRVSFANDNTHLASFSDDKSVAVWDIPTENRVVEFSGHKDYIRSGCPWSDSSDMYLSGSYDHTVRLWDMRQNPNSPILTCDHGAPVEDVLGFPTGGLFVSCGGTEICVWDAIAGGRLLARLSQHHKTVTCLRLSCNNTRMLSGALDRHVKVFDVATYEVVHTLDFPSSVLTMAIAPEDETLLVGMVDGLVSVARKHNDGEKDKEQSRRQREKTSFLHKIHAHYKPTPDEIQLPDLPQNRLSKYDSYLARFEYSRALDEVIRVYYTNKKPAITIAVMQELMRRDGLRAAVAGREGKELSLLVQFVVKHISNPFYMKTMLAVASIMVDVYGPLVNASPEIRKFVKRFQMLVDREYELQKECMKIRGVLEMVLARKSAAASAVQSAPSIVTTEKLAPSESAQKGFVVSVT